MTDILLGQGVRFLLGVLLMATFALWFNQNSERILGRGGDASEVAAVDDADDLQQQIDRASGSAAQEPVRAGWFLDRTRPLQVPLVPDAVSRWLGGWRAAAAGAMLLIGAFFFGRLLGAIVLLSALIALIGPAVWVESLELSPRLGWIPLAAAAGLWATAVFFLRVDED